MIPSWTLTIGGTTTITDDFNIKLVNVRPENNISSLAFTVNDYNSRSYSDLFDVNTQIDLALTCKNFTGTTTFSGLIHNLKPVKGVEGEVMQVDCWGWGIALAKTLCTTSFGLESADPTLTHPQEIIQDIVTHYVKGRFGAGDTQWDLDNTDVEQVHNLFDITNLTCAYIDNFTVLQRICDLANAYARINADIGCHWYVDTTTAAGVQGHLRVKEIDNNSTDLEWMHYYGGSATTATLYEDKHFVGRNFHKSIEDYANHIVVAAGFRRPSYDVWTESTTGWADDDVTLTADACGGAGEPADAVVGTYALKAVAEIAGVCYFYYDFATPLVCSHIGSNKTIPKLGFYLATDDVSNSPEIGVNLYTTRQVDEYIYEKTLTGRLLEEFLVTDNVWKYFEIPIGPHAHDADGGLFKWSTNGTPSWDNVVGIEFAFTGQAGPPYNIVFVDDIHFTGKIVRSCYDTSAITSTTKERQVLIRLDSATDDTLVDDDDDAGQAALVAVNELYRRSTTPIVGTIEMPMHEDILPGQTLQIYAGKRLDGTYRWSNTPMRAKQITHIVDDNGFRTQIELTSDVTNSNVIGNKSAWDILMENAGALGHGQAKDLKSSGIDELIERLAWDPT